MAQTIKRPTVAVFLPSSCTLSSHSGPCWHLTSHRPPLSSSDAPGTLGLGAFALPAPGLHGPSSGPESESAHCSLCLGLCFCLPLEVLPNSQTETVCIYPHCVTLCLPTCLLVLQGTRHLLINVNIHFWNASALRSGAFFLVTALYWVFGI